MLTHHDGSAPLGSRGAFENTSHLNYTTKKFPPFGKQLNDLRLSGCIPYLRIIVTTDWNLGRLFPRLIITKQILVNQLIFDYLSGLSVQIVYHEGEEELLDELTDEILRVKPKTLAHFNIDYPALKLIYPATVKKLEALEWK